jgi:hypothetical protein
VGALVVCAAAPSASDTPAAAVPASSRRKSRRDESRAVAGIAQSLNHEDPEGIEEREKGREGRRRRICGIFFANFDIFVPFVLPRLAPTLIGALVIAASVAAQQSAGSRRVDDDVLRRAPQGGDEFTPKLITLVVDGAPVTAPVESGATK